MANFIDSFNKGIKAADKARANKDEIFSVIADLSDQLSLASEGKLKIDVVEKNETMNPFSITAKDLFGRKTYSAIVASNPLAASYRPEELARWRISESGYPCHVALPDTEIYCEDKVALENALARLIATPAAGKVLQSVMNQQVLTDDDF